MIDILRRRRAIALLMLMWVACCLPVSADAIELRARVVGITDGDTVTVLTDERRQMLAGLVFERRVLIIVSSTDRNGRLIGRVFVGSRDINAEMVRRGSAWVFRRYSSDAAQRLLEEEARGGALRIAGSSASAAATTAGVASAAKTGAVREQCPSRSCPRPWVL